MKKIILNMIALGLVLVFCACCGGGGGNKGRVIGTTYDSFGAPVGGNAVTIVFAGLPDVYHPAQDGSFDISVPEGSYNVEFLWYDKEQGIEIYHQKNNLNVVKGQTLNLGDVPLANSELTAGWASYRGGKYNDAITHFNNYLTDVRNGHAVSGSNSAFVGLGWSYARLGDFTTAFTNLDTALSASGGTNSDALVGLGGLFLSLGYDGASYTYSNADLYLTSAINLQGDYSSFPTHDHISETDLYAARAMARFLNGDIGGAQADLNVTRATVDAEGNFASLDTLNMLDWLIANI